jgi:hypothetical protein
MIMMMLEEEWWQYEHWPFKQKINETIVMMLILLQMLVTIEF